MRVKYGIRAAALVTLMACGLTACGSEAEPMSEEGIRKALPTEETLPKEWDLRHHEANTEGKLWGTRKCENLTDTKCPGFVAVGGVGLAGPDFMKTGRGPYGGVTILSFETAENAEAALKGRTKVTLSDTPLEIRTGADQTVARRNTYWSTVAMRIGSTFVLVTAQVQNPQKVENLAQSVADRVREQSES
ncbi:hypothetical protein ACWD01_08265 [Streptomyces sp. NPDC002835]|jgi:hypothetical protein